MQANNAIQYASPAVQAQQKQILDKISSKAPRFLFRGWSSNGWAAQADLNRADSIKPLHFAAVPTPNVIPLYMRSNIASMVDRHVWTNPTYQTEFTSWSNSFGFALNFAATRSEGYISFIDRELFDAETKKVAFYNVLDLTDAGFGTGNFGGEFLAHGIIQGPGLFCVPLSAFSEEERFGLAATGIHHNYLGSKETMLKPRDDTLRRAISNSVFFARNVLGQPAQALIEASSSPAFYTLVLTWLAVQSNQGVSTENCMCATAIIHQIKKHAQIDVPFELARAFVDRWSDKVASHCIRTYHLVHAVHAAKFGGQRERRLRSRVITSGVEQGQILTDEIEAHLEKRLLERPIADQLDLAITLNVHFI